MNEGNVKQDIVDTISDKRTLLKKVKIKINYRSRLSQFLARIYLLPRYTNKNIYLSNLWPGTVFRLLGVILKLKANKSFQDIEIYDMIKENIPVFVEFLAIGLHNDESNPPEWLFRALNYQISNDEMREYVTEVYRRLDVQTFFVTTESLIELQSLSHILDPKVHGQ